MSNIEVVRSHQRTARLLSRDKPVMSYSQWLAAGVRMSINHDTNVAGITNSFNLYIDSLRQLGENKAIEILERE